MDILREILTLNALQFQALILVVCRLSGIFLTAPLFSHRNIPGLVKIGLLIFLSLCVFSLLSLENFQPSTNSLVFFLDIFQELLVGLVLGFCANLIFLAIQIAGQIIDYQMGFGFVNILDPEARIQIPIIGQFLFILTMLIFLVINGHHWFIHSLVRSFEVIPLGGWRFNPDLIRRSVLVFSEIFVIGFKISAPVLISLFLVDLAYGVVGRAVPQANILNIGFPLKIGLGLFFLLLSLPLFFVVVKRFILETLFNLNVLLKLM